LGAKTIGDVLALPANGKLGGVVCDDDLDGWLDDGCTDWLVVVAGVAATSNVNNTKTEVQTFRYRS
jgi:hypothetical protein